ncbi:hypothetical protein [Bacillus sp. 1P02SD]|uniref:hypothetical protein n=1 Tax=Bacillus sp. 1P02SD TaxID=3132264 RepID=UPI0039A32DC8
MKKIVATGIAFGLSIAAVNLINGIERYNKALKENSGLPFQKKTTKWINIK